MISPMFLRNREPHKAKLQASVKHLQTRQILINLLNQNKRLYQKWLKRKWMKTQRNESYHKSLSNNLN